MTAATLLLINAAATWYMTGLIWMVQIVHYKMFDRVGADVFARYATDHSRLITPIVGVPMLIELATAAALCWVTPRGVASTWMIAAAGLVAVLWLSTALLQVPAHTVLAGGFDVEAYRRLVGSNWIRTAAWSARGVLMMLALHQHLTALNSTP